MQDFLEYRWGSERLFVNLDAKLVADEAILAVILACQLQNLDRFMALGEFRQILATLGLRADIFSVQSAQSGAINALKNAKISKTKLLNALALLRNERVIDEADFVNLSDFLQRTEQLDESSTQTSQIKHDFFHERTAVLNFSCERLLALSDEPSRARLLAARQKIDELKFNIVVTGVINAGKSTLLNALLGRQILGSSNVPETANLTLLTHRDDETALVSFWSQSELAQLGVSTDEQGAKFADSELAVAMEELASYTSAKFELSKLVKSVRIGANLELLKDGVQIVDTPGIDDAVFLREQLVREYMSECDLMVHLMNASQAATQKELDFIVRSLSLSHIVRIVVVLTHADLLNERELAEVAAYTQKAVRAQLMQAGLDELASGLKIFIVSAREYLQNPEKGGVGEFKSYLYETLFGADNEKTALSVAAYERELRAVAIELLARTKEDLLDLSGSNLELCAQISALLEQKTALQNELSLINQTVASELAKIDADALNAGFLMELKQLGEVVKNRLLNEAKYAQKNGSTIDKEQASYIIATALNDGILNAARIKRNEILAQIRTCKQNLALKVGGFELGAHEQGQVFNVGQYLATQGVSFEYSRVSEKVAPFLGRANELESALNLALGEFLSDDGLANFVLNLAEFEKIKFKDTLARELEARQNTLNLREQRLLEHSEMLTNKGGEIAANLASLQERERDLEAILKELEC